MAEKKSAERRLRVPYAQIELKNGTRLHLMAGDTVPSEATSESAKTLEDLGFLSSDDDFLADNT